MRASGDLVDCLQSTIVLLPPSSFQASRKHAMGQQTREELLSLNAAQVPLTFPQLGQGSSSWGTTGYEFLITAVIKTGDGAKPASVNLCKACMGTEDVELDETSVPLPKACLG